MMYALAMHPDYRKQFQTKDGIQIYWADKILMREILYTIYFFEKLTFRQIKTIFSNRGFIHIDISAAIGYLVDTWEYIEADYDHTNYRKYNIQSWIKDTINRELSEENVSYRTHLESISIPPLRSSK